MHYHNTLNSTKQFSIALEML